MFSYIIKVIILITKEKTEEKIIQNKSVLGKLSVDHIVQQKYPQINFIKRVNLKWKKIVNDLLGTGDSRNQQ